MNINNNNNSIFSQEVFQELEYKNHFNKEEEETDKTFQEQRNLYKLSLRKKKIEEIISAKRCSNMIPSFKSLNENLNNNIDDYLSVEHEIIKYTKNDFLSGDIFTKLKSAYESKDEKEIKEIIKNISNFFNKKNLDNIELRDLIMNSGNNVGNKKEKFAFGVLLLNIGLFTKDKFTYIYCFNFILNLSFISDEFCKEITTEKNINLIFEKLIYFYPLFVEKNKINSNVDIESDNLNEFNDNTNSKEKIQSFYIGGQILKLLGNLFISSENYFEPFEKNNFYVKIFYLLINFSIDPNDEKYKNIYFEFLETLIWLMFTFLERIEKLIINYNEQLIEIIACLLKDVKMLYFTQAKDLLEKIIDLIFYLSWKHSAFNVKIIEEGGLDILTNLFSYLFNYNNANENCEIILSGSIIDKILSIFINIFSLDSKYLKSSNDYLNFALVIEKLISIYKLHVKNHFEIQEKLISIISNLACFDDIENIVKKFILNKNIIKDLFKYYNPNHKKDIILLIDNVVEKQTKKVRDFILELGAFDIIKDNICNYNDNDLEVVKKSIKTLNKIIEKEKAFNIRLFFEKIYNTAIPEKIKKLFYDKNMANIDTYLKNLINDFDIYENSLNLD